MKAIINLRITTIGLVKEKPSITDLDERIKKQYPNYSVESIDSISSCKISDVDLLVIVGVTLENKAAKDKAAKAAKDKAAKDKAANKK